MLSVSEATLRNWVKLGIVETESRRPLSFKRQHIDNLLRKIENGGIQRLNSRANKLHSNFEASNIGHLADQSLKFVATKIIERHQLEGVSYLETLASCTLLILAIQGKVSIDLSKSKVDLDEDIEWHSDHLLIEFGRWRDLLNSNMLTVSSEMKALLEPTPKGDLLGVIYQGIIREGDKSKLGSYYTPSHVIEHALALTTMKNGKFLDPCCGTGQFLIHAIRKFSLKPSEVYGIDLDPIAVQIARFNLLQEFDFEDIEINVIQGDTITEIAIGTLDSEDDFLGQFDVIATNPPWGAIGAIKKRLPPEYKTVSGEMFSLIIEKSLSMLKKDGQISMVLPESILKINVHKDIREVLLRKTSLKHIVEIGRPFPGVMSNVVLLSLKKSLNEHNEVDILLEGSKDSFKVKQEKFLTNGGFFIDLNSTPFDDLVLEQIYSRDIEFLGDRSEWALGVVTGNNKVLLSDKCEEGMVSVYIGKEVHRFSFSKPSHFFFYIPESFQQVPPNEIFTRREKLVYRFISKKLIFALDVEQRITLNSANILIPNLNSMPIEVALGFLNSKVFQYVYEKKFSTTKVLKNNLKKLPFPVLEQSMQDSIVKEVRRLTSDPGSNLATLDSLVFRSFDLSDDFIAHIEKELGK